MCYREKIICFYYTENRVLHLEYEVYTKILMPNLSMAIVFTIL